VGVDWAVTRASAAEESWKGVSLELVGGNEREGGGRRRTQTRNETRSDRISARRIVGCSGEAWGAMSTLLLL